MPRIPLLLLSLVLGAACALLVSCGGGTDKSKLLPPDSASAMIDNLEQVQRLAEDGDCNTAANEAANALNQARGLGPEVDPGLKKALEDGFRHLQVLAQNPEACTVTQTETEATTAETTTATTTTTPTVTATTPTVTATTPTQTAPPPTTQGGGGGGTDGGGGTGTP